MRLVDYYAPMNKPSRQFFVHQAVLNTLLDWFPSTAHKCGMARAAKEIRPFLWPNIPYGKSFVIDVAEEFRKLEAQYQ